MMKTIVTNLIENYKKSASYWSGSIFESVTHFSTDYKGKFGEELLFNVIKDNTNIPVEWDEDQNTNNNDGVYDLFWYLHNGKKMRVEVKTSGRTFSSKKGKPTGWQHENVYFSNNEWDKLVFIDYDANDVVFFTIVDYNQVVKDNKLDLSLIGLKGGHQRKNEKGKAKVDSSMTSLQKGIDNKVTFEYDFNNPDNEGLSNFLEEKLGK